MVNLIIAGRWDRGQQGDRGKPNGDPIREIILAMAMEQGRETGMAILKGDIV